MSIECDVDMGTATVDTSTVISKLDEVTEHDGLVVVLLVAAVVVVVVVVAIAVVVTF